MHKNKGERQKLYCYLRPAYLLELKTAVCANTTEYTQF